MHPEFYGTKQNKINPKINQNTCKCISGSWALLLLSEIMPKWKLANSSCYVFFGQVFKGAYYLCVQILS